MKHTFSDSKPTTDASVLNSVEFYRKSGFYGTVRKIIVTSQNIKETLDENGFVIIGAVDFLLRFIK